MKTIENRKNRITFYDDYVVKEIKDSYESVGGNWLQHYQAIATKNPAMINVYRVISSHKFEMEHIDIQDNVENMFKNLKKYPCFDKNMLIDIVTIINKCWIDSLEYSRSLPGDDYFMNCDVSLSNMVITTDNKIRVLDPEGFAYITRLDYTEKYYMTQINLMYNIQKYYSIV